MPDFIHDWGPAPFRRTGYALAAATAGAAGLSVVHELGHIMPVAMGLFTAGYWTLGLRDLSQKHQALRKNFPVLIHFRYILESLRPEIQQYLIESDEQAVPFSREMRSIVYRPGAHTVLLTPYFLLPTSYRLLHYCLLLTTDY